MEKTSTNIDTYKELLYEVDAMHYTSFEEKLTVSEWKEMNDKLQTAYNAGQITKQQYLHFIALMTNYHCVEG